MPRTSTSTSASPESTTDTSPHKHPHLHHSRPPIRTSNSIRQTWSPASARARPKIAHGRFSHFDITHDEFNTHAFVDQDGRIHIDFNKLKEGPLSIFLNGASKNHFPHDGDQRRVEVEVEVVAPPPKLNIVVMVIGSRGDVQPFVAVAKVLAEQGGHRVRLATHPAFKEFVEENGVEFFDVGGDPAELMAFMVKNPVSLGIPPLFFFLRVVLMMVGVDSVTGDY